MFQDSPFSSAVQRAEVKIRDSTVKSVTSQETFLYRPFGPIDDAVTKIIVSMSLDLKKQSTVHVRKKKQLSRYFSFPIFMT